MDPCKKAHWNDCEQGTLVLMCWDLTTASSRVHWQWSKEEKLSSEQQLCVKYLVGVDVSSRRSKSDIISKQFFKHENHFTGFKSTKSGSNRAAVAVVEVDICIMMWRWHVCSNCVTLSCYHGENVSLLKLYYKEWSSSEGKRAPAHY